MLPGRPPATESFARVGAAIDVGSNSVHLLVARVAHGPLDAVLDESELLGLGDVVDRDGAVPPDAALRVISALDRYVRAAIALGAREPVIVGTEPLRRAANASDLVARVREATGSDLHVLSHELEGLLTLIGVTHALEVERPLLVVDIGGGSTEWAIETEDRAVRLGKLSIGSARLTRALVRHDPPTSDELALVRTEAARHVGAAGAGTPRSFLVAGGTGSNLVKLLRPRRGDRRLDRAALATIDATLRANTAAALVERYAVNPRRARQLPVGAAIVEAFLDHYGLEAAVATEASLRDGAILAHARFGAEWPRQLAALVRDATA